MIDILYLTGDFIEKNGKTENWSEFLSAHGLSDTTIITRRAFLEKRHFSYSSSLLDQDFEVHSAENSDYALALDAAAQREELPVGARQKTLVIPWGETDIRPLLKLLHDKIQVIVLSNQAQPESCSSLCANWIDISGGKPAPVKAAAADTPAVPEKPVEQLEPDDAFWKDKIQKSLPSFVEARGGVVEVQPAVQWLYSLQLNVALSAVKEEQVSSENRGRALLKQYLPANIRWEESADGQPQLRDIRRKDFQTVSAAEAVTQLQIGAKFSSDSPAPAQENNFMNFSAVAVINHIIAGSEIMANHCRWTIQREDLIRQKADFATQIAPTDASFLRQAADQDVFIWTIRNPFASTEAYEHLGRCYDTLFAAFKFLNHVEQNRPEGIEGKDLLVKAAQIAANAQCILKTELRSLGKEITIDPLQNEAFRYLRELGNRERFFLYKIKAQEEMPLDQAAEQIDEITLLQEQYFSKNAESKQKRNLLGKLDYHIKQLKDGNNPAEQWEKIISSATELSAEFSMPPSDLFFRQQLEGIIDSIPEDLEITDEFAKIVQEIEIYTARVREAEEMEAFGSLLPDNVPMPSVEKVRHQFGFTKMVFVGGEPKEQIIRRIEERFSVKLIWNSISKGDSLNQFDGELSDAEVTIFLIYSAWCRRNFAKELAAMVEKVGKKVVWLRKGTNPDIIAEAICQQAAEEE